MDPLSSARASRTLDRLEQRRRRLARHESLRSPRPEPTRPAVPQPGNASGALPLGPYKRDAGSRQALRQAEQDVDDTTRRARRMRLIVGSVMAELAAFFTLGMF